jgi:hypothetical protein
MAIFTIISGIFSAISSAVKAMLSAIPPIGWLVLVVFVVGVYLGSGCEGCRRKRREPKIVSKFFTVDSVSNGATIAIKIRKRKTKLIQLYGISSNSSIEAIDNLKKFAGEKVRIEMSGLFGMQLPNPAIVYGESGCCLNLEQIKAGMADVLDGVPSEWIKERDIAKRKKLGIWSN